MRHEVGLAMAPHWTYSHFFQVILPQIGVAVGLSRSQQAEHFDPRELGVLQSQSGHE